MTIDHDIRQKYGLNRPSPLLPKYTLQSDAETAARMDVEATSEKTSSADSKVSPANLATNFCRNRKFPES
jgi:hypothetical protein